MKKYAILAIAVVLAVLLTAAGAEAFSFNFKFFKPLAKYAKVTPTSTSNAPAQSSGFCGFSSYGLCNSNDDCFRYGCSAQLCRSVFDPDSGQGSQCDVKECYYNDGKYNLRCGCLKNQCQWARPYEFSNPNQGQGQGSGGSGNGNGQSSQGQQGTGMGESQSQNYGEGGSSFQCLNLAEEKKCIDSEGVHEYCTNVGGCYTTRTYYCESGENGIQRCVASAVAAVCKSGC